MRTQLVKALRDELASHTTVTSAELVASLGVNQTTISRGLQSLRGEVVRFGRARSTRYALLEPLYGLPATQPVRWVDASGNGMAGWYAHHLHDGVLALTGPGVDIVSRSSLPWPLASIRRQGYLGRLAAENSIFRAVLGGDLDAWSAAAHLFAAVVEGFDLPGAAIIGSPPQRVHKLVPPKRTLAYDMLAQETTAHLTPGSSAAGEQPKFLASDGAQHFIVKFSPPHGTPFGDLWAELLRAEAIAHQLLADAGSPVASCRVITSQTRTYLESTRFDRVGAHGRRHALALNAIHDAFVHGPRQHWVATCERLVEQGRLPAQHLAQVRLWRAFGRLIANTDMHFGNLSLFVEDIKEARFLLAPCYDMLPMFYRPNLHDQLGAVPFQAPDDEPNDRSINTLARQLAQSFWEQVGAQAKLPAWRAVCAANLKSVS